MPERKNSLSSDGMSLIGREWQRNVQKRKTHVQSVQNYMVKYANLWPPYWRDKTLQKGEDGKYSRQISPNEAIHS